MMNSDHMGPVNLGNPGEFSIRQLAEMVRDKINPDLQLIHLPLPADDPLQRQPVIVLARQELGWQPSIDLEQGLDATIAYFRQALG
jgi:UDP-glucuronate decarboxylase